MAVPSNEDEGEDGAVQPVAAGERRELLFADDDGGEVKQVDIEGKADEGGQDFLIAALTRLATREERQAEGVDDEGERGIAARLPFAEVFGAGAEFAGRDVAQAGVFAGEGVGTGQAQVGVVEGEEGGAGGVVVIRPGEAAAMLKVEVAFLFAAAEAAAIGKDDAVPVGFLVGDEEIAQFTIFDSTGVDNGAVIKAAEGVGGKEDHAGFLLGLLAQAFLTAIDAGENSQAEDEQQQANGGGTQEEGAGLVFGGDTAGEDSADFLVAVKATESHHGGEDEGDGHEDDEETHGLQADELPDSAQSHVAGGGSSQQGGEAKAEEDGEEDEVGGEKNSEGFADEVAVEYRHGERGLCYASRLFLARFPRSLAELSRFPLMKFSLKVCAPAELAADVLAVSVAADGAFSARLAALDAVSGGFFAAQRDAGNFPPKDGTSRLFVNVPNVAAARVIVVRHDGSDAALERATAAVQALADESGWGKVGLLLGDGAHAVDVMARAAAYAAYRFDAFKSDAGKARKHEWLFVCDRLEKAEVQATLELAHAWALGSTFTRDLVNTPPNVCTPAWLGDQAKALAKAYAPLSAKVLKRKDIEALGMGALLGVAQGSANEPRFIVFEYRPANAQNAQPFVLVGKGVTFDTGGISIKPSAAMDEMKGDMGGAAAVFGALKALCEAELPLYVVGLVAAVENMPDGNAIRPGDILTSMSGKTVEVLNTDAEGRLILCDALTYAARYKPQAVIDMATLTGAIVVALGGVRSGLFANDDALADALFAAGEAARDLAWKMPLDPAYRDMLKSPFADLPNISGSREAGAVTAAAFLSAFVDYPWAHLDIAGSAFKGSTPKGGTGRPVGLLLEFFRNKVA